MSQSNETDTIEAARAELFAAHEAARESVRRAAERVKPGEVLRFAAPLSVKQEGFDRVLVRDFIYSPTPASGDRFAALLDGEIYGKPVDLAGWRDGDRGSFENCGRFKSVVLSEKLAVTLLTDAPTPADHARLVKEAVSDGADPTLALKAVLASPQGDDLARFRAARELTSAGADVVSNNAVGLPLSAVAGEKGDEAVCAGIIMGCARQDEDGRLRGDVNLAVLNVVHAGVHPDRLAIPGGSETKPVLIAVAGIRTVSRNDHDNIVSAVSNLVENGASVAAQWGGETALHAAVRASRGSNAVVAGMLARHGAFPAEAVAGAMEGGPFSKPAETFRSGAAGSNALHVAASDDKRAAVAEIVQAIKEQHGPDAAAFFLSMRDRNGNTPLALAAHGLNEGAVLALLANMPAGLNPDQLGVGGTMPDDRFPQGRPAMTPLHLSASAAELTLAGRTTEDAAKSARQIAAMLIEAGCDPKALNGSGRTPSETAREQASWLGKSTRPDRAAICDAVSEGISACIKTTEARTERRPGLLSGLSQPQPAQRQNKPETKQGGGIKF